MNSVFLLTGSNLGDSITLLNKANEYLGTELGRVIKKSHIYRSKSWGYKSQGLYCNQCIRLETDLDPQGVLKKILDIEAKMGRQRKGEGYSDREIDIDILFYNRMVIKYKNLTIPHPRVHLRKFALVPMNEIAGKFVHPVFKKAIFRLLEDCQDESKVEKID